MKGYAEITWPIEGEAVLEKAQNVTINGYNLKLANERRVAEEYDLFTQDGVPVAHLRLRDGRFVAATPDRFGTPVYNVRIEGTGERGPSMFEATDRRRYLTEAVAFVDGDIRKAAIVAKLTRV